MRKKINQIFVYIALMSMICSSVYAQRSIPSGEANESQNKSESTSKTATNQGRQIRGRVVAGGLALVGAGFLAGAGLKHIINRQGPDSSKSPTTAPQFTMPDEPNEIDKPFLRDPIPVDPKNLGPVTLNGIEDLIINGNWASVDQYNFFVMPLISSSQGDSWSGCGASLIADNIVLTAAHCLDRGVPNSVYIGALSPWSSGGNNRGQMRVLIDVVDSAVHPKYDPTSNRFDIALLKLDISVGDQISNWYGQDISQDSIKPITLGDAEFVSQMKDGDPVTVMGFGVTETGGTSANLLYANLDFVSTFTCRETMTGIGFVSNDMLCAHSQESSNACNGDSGGPLIDESLTEPVQVGVVSWGVPTCPGSYPVVYAKPSIDLDWIREEACPFLDAHRSNRGYIKDLGYLCSQNPNPPSNDDRPTPNPTEPNEQCEDVAGEFEFVDSRGHTKVKQCSEVRFRDCEASDIVMKNCPKSCEACTEPTPAPELQAALTCQDLCPSELGGVDLNTCSKEYLKGSLSCTYTAEDEDSCQNVQCPRHLGNNDEYDYKFGFSVAIDGCKKACYYDTDVEPSCEELCPDVFYGRNRVGCDLHVEDEALTCLYDSGCDCPSDDIIGNGFEFDGKSRCSEDPFACHYAIYN